MNYLKEHAFAYFFFGGSRGFRSVSGFSFVGYLVNVIWYVVEVPVMNRVH